MSFHLIVPKSFLMKRQPMSFSFTVVSGYNGRTPNTFACQAVSLLKWSPYCALIFDSAVALLDRTWMYLFLFHVALTLYSSGGLLAGIGFPEARDLETAPLFIDHCVGRRIRDVSLPSCLFSSSSLNPRFKSISCFPQATMSSFENSSKPSSSNYGSPSAWRPAPRLIDSGIIDCTSTGLTTRCRV